jgi:hypothetical protein
MFKKGKKKPEISTPSNFEHRVHTGFDRDQGKYVGLPPQWAGIIIPEENERRKPIIDASCITQTDIQPLKVRNFKADLFSSNISFLKRVEKLQSFRQIKENAHI